MAAGESGASAGGAPLAPRRRFLVVHNSFSGPRWRQPLVAEVIGELRARGAEVDRAGTHGFETDRAFAAKVAANASYDCLVAAGGDGTLRSLASGLIGRSLPIGLVPLGTGNVMAREIGLSWNAAEIAATLLSGDVLPVRPGLANRQPFMLMAGAGVDARILGRLSVPLKRRIGQAAYTPATLAEVMRPLETFPVVVDGVESEASWAIVTRVGNYAGKFLIARHQELASDRFHAVLVRTKSRARLLGIVMEALTGRLKTARDIEVVPCTTARLGGTVAVQVDGEEAGCGPLDIEMAGAPVQLIVPRGRSR